MNWMMERQLKIQTSISTYICLRRSGFVYRKGNTVKQETSMEVDKRVKRATQNPMHKNHLIPGGLEQNTHTALYL